MMSNKRRYGRRNGGLFENNGNSATHYCKMNNTSFSGRELRAVSTVFQIIPSGFRFAVAQAALASFRCKSAPISPDLPHDIILTSIKKQTASW